MKNYLRYKPVRVVWLKPAQDDINESSHTFCFVGADAPVSVRASFARLNVEFSEPNANNVKILASDKWSQLKDYYNAPLREIFGANLMTQQMSKLCEICEPVANVMSRIKKGGGNPPPLQPSAPTFGDNDDELKEIAQLLETPATGKAKLEISAQIERAPQFANGGITLVPDLQMFPDDSFADIKRKIYSATKIPIYRQHLVAISLPRDGSIGNSVISYSISTTGTYVVNFCDLFAQHSDDDHNTLFNISIDETIYRSRDELRIEARDHITAINDIAPDFFIVLDLANWIIPQVEYIRAILTDNYQFELLYYGFIVKYFPQLTRECFYTYLTNEIELTDRFPDLAPVLPTVRDSVLTQCKICRNVYSDYNKKEIGAIDHVILHASVSSQCSGGLKPVNLRNLFDSVICSKTITQIYAIVDSIPFQNGSREISRFELRKFYKSFELMSAFAYSSSVGGGSNRSPPLSGEPGVVIVYTIPNNDAAMDNNMYMMIRATGKITFQFQWHEEDEITFSDMVAIFSKHTRIMLNELLEMGVHIASYTEPITPETIHIQSLAVAMRWKRIISAKQFKMLHGMFNEYYRADIMYPRQTAKDALSFVFTRGISNIDFQQLEHRLAAANITEANHYAYLSVSAIRQKWLQNFAGRIVNITHRAVDVRFDIHDAYESEYRTFEQYLTAFINNFAREITHQTGQSFADAAREAEIDPSRRRLRRMQDIDPVLYNLKKHGAPRVYSTRCQHGKQPILYSHHEEETKRVPRDAVRYWNFTTNKPAYYSCPDKRYPHLNFLINVHPKGYCIPCCGRIKPAAGSKHAQIEKICSASHTFDVARISEMPISYVMSFGKDLPEGRLSHLPAGYLRDSLNNASNADKPGTELLVFGVPQNMGIINTLCVILDLTMGEFVDKIVRGISTGIIPFDTIAGGQAATYFITRAAFAGYIALLATGKVNVLPPGTQDFMRVLLTDCMRIVFNVGMIYLIGAEHARDMRLIVSQYDITQNKIVRVGFAIIMHDDINPILQIDSDEFVRKGTITSRDLPQRCMSILFEIARDKHAISINNRAIDLQLIENFCKYKKYQINKRYVGKRGLCYATLIDMGNSINAYIPCEFSMILGTMHSNTIEQDSQNDTGIYASHCVELVEQINKYITTNTSIQYHTLSIGALISVHNAIIGCMLTGGRTMMVYFDKYDIDEETESKIFTGRQTLTIDPREHLRMYVSDIANTQSIAKHIALAASFCAYPYYEYELFCAHFMAQILVIQNSEIRAKLNTIISSQDSQANKLEKLNLLGLSKHDISIIVDSQLGKRAKTSHAIQQLDADLIDFYAKIDGSREDLQEWIIQLMRDRVIRTEKRNIRVPAIIAPCDAKTQTREHAIHCSSEDPNKLLINAPLESLVSILASDLQNPIKRAYIISRGSSPESRAAFSDFTFRNTEVLVVKKYEL